MKQIFTIILAAITFSLFAQTEIEGDQFGVWELSGSPYLVIGETTVPAGELLTIEAGVKVKFQGNFKLNIIGNLQAIGTETDSIFFTTDNPQVGWGGIRIDTDNYNDIIQLSFCRIEYGKTTGDYPSCHGGGLALFTSNAVISNSVFADNEAVGNDLGMGGAIYAYNTGSTSGEPLTTITNCKFLRNNCYGEGGAIKFTGDNYTAITNCEFLENNCLYGGGAISFYSVIGTKVTKTLFAHNYTMYASGGAIHMLGMGNSIFLENCTVTDNQAVTGDAGGVYVVNGNADLVNCIIYNNPGAYSNNLFVGFGGYAEVNYSNLEMPDGATGSNNINENPLFINATIGDFHLNEESPCIDSGTDIGLPFYGVAPDMGCFEFQLAEAPFVIEYSPEENEIAVENFATVSVVFNEDVSEVDFSNIEIRDNNNILVENVSTQVESDNITVTISHENFLENKTYTVLIPENSVQNSASIGNDEISWSFTTISTFNIQEQTDAISIYPNPTKGVFNFDEIENIEEIKIVDICGKIVYNNRYYNQLKKNSIDISHFKTGIYFIKINSREGIFTAKIVKK